jgi:hypothetical protein
MVENEIYFPGWHADLIFSNDNNNNKNNKVIKIHAVEVNGVFRACLLPSGNYNMIAFFQFPSLVVYQIITITSFAIWVLIMAGKYWIKRIKRLK